MKSKSIAFRKKRLRELVFYCCLLAVPITQFCIFYIGVNFNSILLAFKWYDNSAGKYVYRGLLNFERIVSTFRNTSELTTALINSLVAYAAGLIVGVTLALLFSFYIYKKMRGSKFFKVVLFMPSMISSIVMVIMFRYFVENALPGFLNKIFKTNIPPLLSERSLEFGLLIFYSIWIGFGSGILMYTGAMTNISESVVESAKIEGATRIQEFFHITLPLIYPTLVTFLVVGIAGIFTNQLNLYSFYGAGAEPRLQTLGYYLFKDLRNQTLALGETPYLAALGLIFTLVAAPVTLGARWALEKFGPKTM